MKHLHEEAWLIGIMCLSKPHQCEHTANEQDGISTALVHCNNRAFYLPSQRSPKLCGLLRDEEAEDWVQERGSLARV